jgi:hypothetical protein
MKRHVENKTFAKIIRTLGYVLLLVSVSLSALALVYAETTELFMLETIRTLLNPVNDIFASIAFLNDQTYIVLAFGLGLTLLTFTLRRTAVSRVFYGLIVLALTVILLYAEESTLLPVTFENPDFLQTILNQLSLAIDPILELSEFAVPLASLLLVLIGWMVFATKKPKRFSTTFVRLGMVSLFIAVLVLFMATAFADGFISQDIYELIQTYAYFIAFDLIAIGSVFGIIGFMRK